MITFTKSKVDAFKHLNTHLRWKHTMEIKPGYRFERLTILAEDQSNWSCQCECGKIKHIRKSEFIAGYHKSCGCLRGENHGMSNTPEYQIWVGMKRRCFDVKKDNYSKYGGRGIAVCDRWMSFINFYADMGPRPSNKHSIERQNVNGNYEPGNCYWATLIEQANNKRNNVVFSIDGQNISRMDLCRKYNINRVTLKDRLKKGMALKEALIVPVRKTKIYFNGESKTLQEWAEITGINYSTLYQRINVYGWTVEMAFSTKV